MCINQRNYIHHVWNMQQGTFLSTSVPSSSPNSQARISIHIARRKKEFWLKFQHQKLIIVAKKLSDQCCLKFWSNISILTPPVHKEKAMKLHNIFKHSQKGVSYMSMIIKKIHTTVLSLLFHYFSRKRYSEKSDKKTKQTRQPGKNRTEREKKVIRRWW